MASFEITKATLLITSVMWSAPQPPRPTTPPPPPPSALVQSFMPHVTTQTLEARSFCTISVRDADGYYACLAEGGRPTVEGLDAVSVAKAEANTAKGECVIAVLDHKGQSMICAYVKP